MTSTAFNLIRAMRRYFRTCAEDLNLYDKEDVGISTALAHLEQLDGDLEFENSEVTDYELETKEEINQELSQLQSFISEMEEQGMRIK